ncbi:hypothetical protein [Telmatospirillum sp.]|uniref:hypothetical protein n=1 Tax=Telmatospirillum sp. TaxID=2079197 RepID=UPI00284B2C74|nr:hypothetical protein [Telmatospirillum sp.]MDR3436917.1 hypothetical protein [Telmatospirillum sp.]
MVGLLIGILVLLAVMVIGRWFATTPPSQVLRSGGWAIALLALAAGIGLAATGRLGWALAGLAALIPWLVRLMHFRNLALFLRRTFGPTARVHAAAGNKSRVETRFLRMSLEHDSGALTGEVLDGPFAGRVLSQLSFAEALELHRYCAADPQSAQLLQAWLDRTWPDWRDQANPHDGGAGGGGSVTGATMTRQEALDILGLSGDADPRAIKAAHRRLMTRLHPDHGGSNYLAAKINQAKDMLLGK